jgi:hypothetical protein
MDWVLNKLIESGLQYGIFSAHVYVVLPISIPPVYACSHCS